MNMACICRDERSFFISSINRGGVKSDDVTTRNDDVIDSESGEGEGGSLLDTFSLSFVGSFDFARTFDGVEQIFQGISSCE